MKKLFPDWSESTSFKEGKWIPSYYDHEDKRHEFKSKILCFGAVEYSKSEGDFLAGPFMHGDRAFGFFTLKEYKGAPSIKKLTELYSNTENPIGMTTTTYMPYAAKKRMEEYFGEGTNHYYVRSLHRSFSGLDLKYGIDELKKDIPNFESELKKAEEKVSVCSLFFTTAGAYKEVLETLTHAELREWKQNKIEANLRILDMYIKTGGTEEYPFALHLFGNDDCSYTTVFKSEEEAVKFIEDELPKGRVATSKMTFTN